jgi:hypothetical protein
MAAQSTALERLQSTSLSQLTDLTTIADVFVSSGLFEDVKDASQAFVKILKGQELGLQPVQAMEAFDIVQKRLFMKPRTIGALINACGYGAYRPLERTPERCVIRFSRRTRDGWVDYPDIAYTLATAEAQGLVQRSPQWNTDPANMLFWRCLGRGGAQYFPELLAGLTPPPDATPIDEGQAAQTIAELWGGPRATTHAADHTADHTAARDRVDMLTGEILGAAEDATPPDAPESFQRDATPDTAPEPPAAEFPSLLAHWCASGGFDGAEVAALVTRKYDMHPTPTQQKIVQSWFQSEGGKARLRDMLARGE